MLIYFILLPCSIWIGTASIKKYLAWSYWIILLFWVNKQKPVVRNVRTLWNYTLQLADLPKAALTFCFASEYKRCMWCVRPWLSQFARHARFPFIEKCRFWRNSGWFVFYEKCSWRGLWKSPQSSPRPPPVRRLLRSAALLRNEYWNSMTSEWKAWLASFIGGKICNWSHWRLPRCLDVPLPIWILDNAHGALRLSWCDADPCLLHVPSLLMSLWGQRAGSPRQWPWTSDSGLGPAGVTTQLAPLGVLAPARSSWSRSVFSATSLPSPTLCRRMCFFKREWMSGRSSLHPKPGCLEWVRRKDLKSI